MRSLEPKLVLLLVSLLSLAFSSKTFGQINFNRQIRPILSTHCTVCHGHDESSREADLRLDTFADATADLGDYFAIVPGEPDKSELIQRVASTDDPMPPAEHGERLSNEEIDLLRRWISEGAEYQTHWSFVKPARPSIPELRAESANNPIDKFVLRQIHSNGLQPNEPADPARLIRRVALDLTGLPPTRDMVDQFIADPTDATYEIIVDRLLSDSAFGEHWASMWLDLARYADTTGYAGDETRTIWPWRDWLIQALNENKPFDQFTLEVLAGDLLPDPTTNQRLATAFHRNTLNNSEGGTNDEEFRTIAVKDRISTTMNTWMGLTMRCAECHSHKYDPISQTEYYQFLDFFNQTADADRGDEYPRIDLQPESLRPKIASLDAQIAELHTRRKQQKQVWLKVRPTETKTEAGTELELQSDHSVLAIGSNPNQDTYTLKFPVDRGHNASGLRIEVLPSGYHAGNVGRGSEGAFVLTQVRVFVNRKHDEAQVPVKLSVAAADYAQKGFGPEHLIRDEIGERDEPLGWAVQHDQQGFKQTRFAIIQFETPLLIADPAEFTVELVFNSKWHHRNAGRVRLSITDVEKPAEKFKNRQLDPLARQIQQLVKRRNEPVKVPVLAELPEGKKRQTHIMKRGNFQNHGDLVEANTPAAFHDFPADARHDRLGVARWLVHEDNPLTARVTMNRYWARLFGKGIVVTEEDFGTQGTPPSHPELLDWLAVDFQLNGWDVKRALKQMVLSQTYQRNGKATTEQLEHDPDNLFLARGPRNRLPAETIRDQALAVSGLLTRKLYGPPVYPPNPIKEVVNAFKGADVWRTSTGEDRYRRSLYTFLKRSQPHPLFETFDTSTRDVCSLRRINTNTPLQSFMTLNDEAFVEAAQALAIRMSRETTLEKQIITGLELALIRPADPQMILLLEKLYQQSLSAYQANKPQATEMLGSFAKAQPTERHPQLASLTVVANVILNLDEFLTH